jgi:protein involved in sex pheromone biosynthesis
MYNWVDENAIGLCIKKSYDCMVVRENIRETIYDFQMSLVDLFDILVEGAYYMYRVKYAKKFTEEDYSDMFIFYDDSIEAFVEKYLLIAGVCKVENVDVVTLWIDFIEERKKGL